MSAEKEAFRDHATALLREAWELNGDHGIPLDAGVEVQLRILNGILAMALVEFTAPPIFGTSRRVVRIRDLLKGDPS